MENESTVKTRSKRTSSSRAASEQPKAEVQEPQIASIQEDETLVSSQPKEPSVKKPIIPKDVDLNMRVVVKNGHQGRLVYKSKRTGEKFVWDSFGAEQDMELGELRNARNSSKSFFENNWFMFAPEDAWVIDYLGVGRYYKYAVSIDDFDRIFEMSAEEIPDVVSNMSNGQKRSVAYRARQLIGDGKIDSIRVINALEKSLGVELIEK